MEPTIRRDPESGRRICTATDPWTAEKAATDRRWMHPESSDDGGCSDGCCDDYVCRVCGLRYRAPRAA